MLSTVRYVLRSTCNMVTATRTHVVWAHHRAGCATTCLPPHSVMRQHPRVPRPGPYGLKPVLRIYLFTSYLFCAFLLFLGVGGACGLGRPCAERSVQHLPA